MFFSHFFLLIYILSGLQGSGCSKVRADHSTTAGVSDVLCQGQAQAVSSTLVKEEVTIAGDFQEKSHVNHIEVVDFINDE